MIFFLYSSLTSISFLPEDRPCQGKSWEFVSLKHIHLFATHYCFNEADDNQGAILLWTMMNIELTLLVYPFASLVPPSCI